MASARTAPSGRAGRGRRRRGLTVAVTGPTGTFGAGLLPLLEADDRVDRVVGVARRPFDPAARGWTKMEYRRGDVRDPEVLEEAFAGADVVVHLAFLITGTSGREVTRAVNVEGSLNVVRAAAAVGARRLVYASSVAAYGFHADNPVGLTEDWPTRPAARLFYAQEKAELERLLGEEVDALPDLDLFLLRPPIVLGPHAVGGKELPAPLMALGRAAAGLLDRLPVALPVPAPAIPIQLVHEDDVGRALQLCVVGAGPSGAYNIAGDGVVTGADVARELGLTPLPVPAGVAHRVARGLAALPAPPFLPPVLDWVEAGAQPSIMDTTKARELLGWEPRVTALEALRSTLHPD